MSEIVILGAQHETNLGDRVVEYDQPMVTNPTCPAHTLLGGFYGPKSLSQTRKGP